VPNNGQNGTDADWKKWITAPSPNGFSAVSHPIGTAAMMKRSLGGKSLRYFKVLLMCLINILLEYLQVWLMHICWFTTLQTFEL
jgi:hypothetical protein